MGSNYGQAQLDAVKKAAAAAIVASGSGAAPAKTSGTSALSSLINPNKGAPARPVNPLTITSMLPSLGNTGLDPQSAALGNTKAQQQALQSKMLADAMKAQAASSAVGSLGPAPSGVGSYTALPTTLSAAEQAAIRQQATNSIHAQLAPSVNALVTQYQQSQQQAIADKAKRETEGKAQVSDIAELFKRLVAQQGQSAAASQGLTDQNRNESMNNYAALQGGIANNYGDAVQGTGNELARLNLGNVIGTANAGSERDSQFLQGLTGIDAANADNNINTQGTALQALYKLFQSNANTESGARQTESKLNTKDAVDEIVQNWGKTQTQLRNSRTTLEGTRGTLIQDLITQLGDKNLAAKQNAVQAANQASQQRASAALEAYKVKLANQPQPVTMEDQLSLALKQAQLDQIIASTKKTAASTPSAAGVSLAQMQANLQKVLGPNGTAW